jgi:hypothetical protein
MTHSNFSIITLFCLLFFFILLSCNEATHQSGNLKIDTSKKENTNLTSVDKSSDSLLKTNDIEEKIIDTIFKLAEVKQRAKYIEQQTKGERHLKVWIEETPKQPGQNYYSIKVGEDNGTNLVTHFNFYVYPDSMRIMYYDIANDSEVTLDKWRKINGM